MTCATGMPDFDIYAELGLNREATAAQIKSAYRRKAKAHHPDVAADKPTAEARMKRINQARDVLLDGARRADYDRVWAATDSRGGRWRSGQPGGRSSRPRASDATRSQAERDRQARADRERRARADAERRQREREAAARAAANLAVLGDQLGASPADIASSAEIVVSNTPGTNPITGSPDTAPTVSIRIRVPARVPLLGLAGLSSTVELTLTGSAAARS